MGEKGNSLHSSDDRNEIDDPANYHHGSGLFPTPFSPSFYDDLITGVKQIKGGLTAIHINYPEGGLSPASAKCQMTEFPGASVHSNILDKYERTKTASAEKCLDIGVFCQAASQETKQTQGKYIIKIYSKNSFIFFS